MARINIETSLFIDYRFNQLCIKLGNQETALGALVRAWIVGQEYWKSSTNGIPKTEWQKQNLNNAIIECGLAADTGDFILLSGSKKHFNWIQDRISAGKAGGISSGISREIIRKKTKQKQAKASKSKQNEPSYSYSYSPSFSSSVSNSSNELILNSLSEHEKLEKIDPILENPKGYESVDSNPPKFNFVAFFCGQYKNRYSINYAVTGKDAGILKNLFTSLGEPRYKKTVTAYLEMTDSWFLTKRHDCSTLSANLASVTHYAETGIRISSQQIKQFEKKSDFEDMMEKIKRGEA